MPSCNINKSSDQGQVLQRCHLIVWDECTMAHKGALEALDRDLRDIRDCQAPIGGVTLLLSGNFRKTLPVIPKGTRADEVHACLKSSTLWYHVTILSLTTNMGAQLHSDQMSTKFAQDILTLGDGKVPLDAAGQMEV
ncbi:ATP-dependent DNA helicase PIF7 [Octopus bimaculoides]|nr:ATP-dependent DNA helicase PIF7 [Octopus bimaculoides]|eukprot:XP_014783649.1 PREDICTED: ATP-dependent DNA helicase PIF7-like [Octopus bimaculoides]